MTLNFFQATTMKKIWVDFTGYTSNQFSDYRLNGRIWEKLVFSQIPFGRVEKDHSEVFQSKLKLSMNCLKSIELKYVCFLYIYHLDLLYFL